MTKFNPYSVIKKQRLDLNCRFRTQQLANDPNRTESEYANLLSELTNGQCKGFGEYKRTKLTYLYLLSNLIREYTATTSEVAESAEFNQKMLEKSVVDADKLIASGQVYYAGPEAYSTYVPVSQSKPKEQRKGYKQIRAKEIYLQHKTEGKAVVMAKFMSELSMSKAGATTYFYNCQKELGK